MSHRRLGRVSAAIVLVVGLMIGGAVSAPAYASQAPTKDDADDGGLLLLLSAGNPMGAGFGVGYGFREGGRAMVELGTLFGLVFHLGAHVQTPVLEMGRVDLYVGASGGWTYTHGCSWGGCGPRAYGVGVGPHTGVEVSLGRSFSVSFDGGILGGRWEAFQGNRGIWRYMIPQVVVRGAYRW